MVKNKVQDRNPDIPPPLFVIPINSIIDTKC